MKKTFCDSCKKEIESIDLFPFDGLPIKLEGVEFMLSMKPFDIANDFCLTCVIKKYLEKYTTYSWSH